jgi:hypothetical protein
MLMPDGKRRRRGAGWKILAGRIRKLRRNVLLEYFFGLDERDERRGYSVATNGTDKAEQKTDKTGVVMVQKASFKPGSGANIIT